VLATLAAPLNAAALWRMDLLINVDPLAKGADVPPDLDRVERLTAKALEVSYIQRRFNLWSNEERH